MLEARDIATAENLIADVEGDIENVDNVLKITQIRLRYKLTIPRGSRKIVDRAINSYASKCPAYQSVKGCIQCTWEAEIDEE